VLLVSEEEIVEAMKRVWERMKIVVEPSSAVALAPLLRPNGVSKLRLMKVGEKVRPRIGVILSGGNVELRW
jgi:threonine dehydratase